MNIDLLAAGTRPPEWIREGFTEYQRRLPRDWHLELHEVPVARRSKNTNAERLKEEEGERMIALVKPGALVIALDRGGATMSTEQLASNLGSWMRDYSRMQFMIGGPDGLAEKCIASAGKSWSLSGLTFPHFIVRVVVAEQLYRAWTILNNHPYHK